MSAEPDAAPAPSDTGADRALLRWLISWTRPYRGRIVGAIALVLAGSAFQIAGPLLTAAAIDLYMKPQPGTSAQHVLHFMQALHLPTVGPAGLAALVALYLASVMGSAFLLILQARTMLMTGQLVMRDLRDALFAHLQRLDVAWFNRTPAGRVITRLTSDVEALNELFTSGLVEILADLSVLGGIATILFALDWRLAFVAFAVLPFMILLSGWFRRRARSIYREVRTRVAAINTHLQEHLSGMSRNRQRTDKNEQKQRHKYPHQDDLEDQAVNRQHRRIDQALLRKEAAGDFHRIAPFLEYAGDIIFVQRVTERGFALFHLRLQILSQFGDDIRLLRLRQPELHGVQVTVDKIGVDFGHGYYSSLL